MLFIWLGIFSLSFIIQEAFRWSNPLEGIFNALIHIVLLGIFWIISFLLWSLPIYGLYRRRPRTGPAAWPIHHSRPLPGT